jgi:hypothetical protein
MKSTYFICMFALLDPATLLCMNESNEMAPVTVQKQIITDMHKPGDGHRVFAAMRLMRTASEKALGVHQKAEVLDVMTFSKIKASTANTDSAEEETESSGSSSSEPLIPVEKIRRKTLPT